MKQQAADQNARLILLSQQARMASDPSVYMMPKERKAINGRYRQMIDLEVKGFMADH